MKKWFLIFLFISTGTQLCAQVNIITTIAGTGTAGYEGDGGLAISAKLDLPAQICTDKAGEIYFADAFNHVIRKITPSGTIVTVAGKGTPGFSGDNGPALDAEMKVPCGIAIDTFGNIYVSDGGNHRVRRIDKVTGIITTFAGTGTAGSDGDWGSATTAKIDGPSGLALDADGNLYISDYSSCNVRKVSAATGIITKIAGTGVPGYSGNGAPAIDAQLSGPFDVFVHTNGDIYISDHWNHVIRKVNGAGIISTVAGCSVGGYYGDGDVATDAKLYTQEGLFIDASGSIYIADYRNGSIRKVDPGTDIISTVAGIGVTGYAGDYGPATAAQLFCTDVWVDKHGNILIADAENQRIRKVNNAVAVEGLSDPAINSLYPDPTNGSFIVHTSVKAASVKVYDMAGIQVLEQAATTNDTEVNIATRPPGIYIVYVQCGGQSDVSKVIKR